MVGKHTFHVSINREPVQTITTHTGQYILAAAAALATLEHAESSNGRDIVKIWSPEIVDMSIKQQSANQTAPLIPQGVYFFSWDGHALGQVELGERW
jgi:hypothetical protein